MREAEKLEGIISRNRIIRTLALKCARLALGLAVVLACSKSLSAQQAKSNSANAAPAKQEKQLNTGPEIGQKIPFFQAPDQNGRLQDLNSIRGPKGAMVVFFRSADW